MLTLAYVLAIALVALGLPLALSLRDRVAAEVHSQARSQADVVAATAATLLDRRAAPQLQALLGTSARAVRGRVIVVGPDGRLLADSATPRAAGASYRDRPEIATALRGRAAQETRRSDTLREDILATSFCIRCCPVFPLGAVRVTQRVTAVHRAVRRALAALAGIGLLVLALGLTAGAVIAAQLARPIHRLDAAARRIEAGDLDTRATVEGSTEQRRLARTFNAMTARLGRLLRGQQEFVADASHHLRTPLAAVRLRLEEARALAAEPAAVAELDAGMREVDRLAATVEELLVLSRSGERELPGEWVDLGAATGTAAERWAGSARARGQRLVSVAATADRVWCARSDLDRILDVLVENALRYAPPGTLVRIAANGPAIAVLDEGPGLAPGEEEAVFERFHRGRAGRAGPPGSGLGLPIARELAAEWNATVAIAARPDRGARATLRFAGPAPAVAALPAGAHASPPTAVESRAPRRDGDRARTAAAVGLLGAAGLVLAAGVALATGSLADGRIGLAGEPVSAAAGLAPARRATATATPPPDRPAGGAPETTAAPSPHRAGPPVADAAAPPAPTTAAAAPRTVARPGAPARSDDGGEADDDGEADD